MERKPSLLSNQGRRNLRMILLMVLYHLCCENGMIRVTEASLFYQESKGTSGYLHIL
jgi:hypothetical protein